MENIGAILILTSFALSAFLFFVLFSDFFLFEWFKQVIKLSASWIIIFSVWLLGIAGGLTGIGLYLWSAQHSGLTICFSICGAGLYSVSWSQIVRLKAISRKPAAD